MSEDIQRIAPVEPATLVSGLVRVVGTAITWIFVFLVYLFLYSPMLVMATFSLNDSKAQTLPFSGFTLRWYRAFLSDNEIHSAIFFSLRVSVVTVLVSLVMGVFFALLLQRLHFPGKGVFQAVVAIPLALPGIVLGISLLLVFRTVGVQPGFITIVAGHATFVTPLIMFVLLQRLRTFDRTLEHASMDLGAGWIKTFWHVTLPEIRIAMVAAALLGFTVSFDEITVTLFLAGLDLTLPVFVWTLLRFGFTPEVNAAFTIIGAGSIVLIGTAAALLFWSGGRDRRRRVMAEREILYEAKVG